jgi:RNA polymerase sigma-70 factor (ECF subfamily)
LSQSEIAEKLNMPLGTVKTHKRKALLKLREILQDLVE